MDDLASVALHLITKQHCLKINAELCNNLNILSLIESIYYVSGDLFILVELLELSPLDVNICNKGKSFAN